MKCGKQNFWEEDATPDIQMEILKLKNIIFKFLKFTGWA